MAKTAKKAPVRKSAAKAPSKAMKPRRALKPGPDGAVRLSGGNPQIAKGYGDAPVQAYIAAMPGWKKEAGRRIDAIVTRTVPGVRKAVKWNSPLYGMKDDHWFLGVHVYEKYIKLAFFMGALLKPPPPDASKQKNVRYLNLHEGQLDEKQFADWARQASKLPGEKM
jgi:hypothetical protein